MWYWEVESCIDLREYMVNDVEVGNVMHQMLTTETEPAIDCCRGAFKERPRLWLVFRDVWVRMMEVGYGYDPVVDPHVGHNIQQRNGFQSNLGARVPKSNHGQSNADVRGQDEMPFFWTEERASRQEVAISEGILGWRVLVRQTSLGGGNVGCQIPGKTEDLLQDNSSEGVKR